MANCYNHTGEKPGSGSYVCTSCGTELSIGVNDTLPPCPKCTNTSFRKEC